MVHAGLTNKAFQSVLVDGQNGLASKGQGREGPQAAVRTCGVTGSVPWPQGALPAYRFATIAGATLNGQPTTRNYEASLRLAGCVGTFRGGRQYPVHACP